MDLVEIVPNADPPVVRVMDVGKFLFEQSKKRHAAKRKQKQIQIKEIKLRPGTDDGDYDIKMRNIKRFLEAISKEKSKKMQGKRERKARKTDRKIK